MASLGNDAALPPPGTEPNFLSPENQMVQNVALHTVCLVLITVFVAMRLYTRIHIIKTALGADDYCCLFSYCLSVAFSGLVLKSYTLGIGRHMWDVPGPWLPFALKFYTIAAQVFMLLSGFVKLAILFSYRHFLSPATKTRYLVNYGIALICCFHTGLYFASLFACRPIAAIWDMKIGGQCFHLSIIPYASGVSSCVMDLYVLLLPLPVVWSLNLSFTWKLRILAVFNLGLLACITSIIRLVMSVRIQRHGDLTWVLSKIALWALIEVDLGILCACLMLLPAFLSQVIPESTRSLFRRFCSVVPGPSSRRSLDLSLTFTDRGHKNWTHCKHDASCLDQAQCSNNRIIRHQSFSINSIRTPQDGTSSSSITGKTSIGDYHVKTTSQAKTFDIP
ncbi:hypothetical protein CDD82_5176 [Ophiocordyceps australis]|uniref:Rhodopsin domain-containing protein n=1 Tax=Ophiocordyceps australis TaxID=1399860 RepID=A0A2C5Z2G1_9HYPO|nr:hypothetical protein CDD82_5176 [Ophiocordyceps australis]